MYNCRLSLSEQKDSCRCRSNVRWWPCQITWRKKNKMEIVCLRKSPSQLNWMLVFADDINFFSESDLMPRQRAHTKTFAKNLVESLAYRALPSTPFVTEWMWCSPLKWVNQIVWYFCALSPSCAARMVEINEFIASLWHFIHRKMFIESTLKCTRDATACIPNCLFRLISNSFMTSHGSSSSQQLGQLSGRWFWIVCT